MDSLPIATAILKLCKIVELHHMLKNHRGFCPSLGGRWVEHHPVPERLGFHSSQGTYL